MMHHDRPFSSQKASHSILAWGSTWLFLETISESGRMATRNPTEFPRMSYRVVGDAREGLMKPNEIKSFQDLENYLADFTTWDGNHVHDFGGAFVLLGAILDNIRKYALEVDIESIGGYLNDEQKAFLQRLAGLSSRPIED